MTLPKGTIWQEIRAKALIAIPVGCKSNFAKPISIRKWLDTGFFSVTCSSSGFELTTNREDFGSALFGDAEHLMDHCTEQMAVTRWHLGRREEQSTAWSFVTCYYWGFFSALLLARLVGRVPMYLDRDHVNKLYSYASAQNPGMQVKKPSPGSYLLSSQSPSGSLNR